MLQLYQVSLYFDCYVSINTDPVRQHSVLRQRVSVFDPITDKNMNALYTM